MSKTKRGLPTSTLEDSIASSQTRVKCVATAHHWVIEMSNGPTSRGECRFCHTARQFTNSAELETHHITLEKDKGYEPTEHKKSWNRWLNN